MTSPSPDAVSALLALVPEAFYRSNYALAYDEETLAVRHHLRDSLLVCWAAENGRIDILNVVLSRDHCPTRVS